MSSGAWCARAPLLREPRPSLRRHTRLRRRVRVLETSSPPVKLKRATGAPLHVFAVEQHGTRHYGRTAASTGLKQSGTIRVWGDDEHERQNRC